MMSESTRKMIEERLQFVDGKISNKEDNIRGGLYMLSVGMAGMVFGVVIKSDSSVLSGFLVSSGSLLFEIINRQALMSYEEEQDLLRFALENPEKVIEKDCDKMSKGDKHFKGKHFKDKQVKGKHFKGKHLKK